MDTSFLASHVQVQIETGGRSVEQTSRLSLVEFRFVIGNSLRVETQA